MYEARGLVVAKDIVNWNIENIRFRAGTVRNALEMEQAERLRFREYVEVEKQIDPQLCPNGRERDDFDNHSEQLVGYMNGQLVGTARLIKCESGCLLDGHVFADGTVFRLPRKHPIDGRAVYPSEMLEFSRWIGRQRKLPSGGRVLISSLMLEAALAATKKLKRRYWISAMKSKNFEHLTRAGWPLVELGSGPQSYHGATVRVCWLDVRHADYVCRKTISKS